MTRRRFPRGIVAVAVAFVALSLLWSVDRGARAREVPDRP